MPPFSRVDHLNKLDRKTSSLSLLFSFSKKSHTTQAKAVDSVMKDINARFGKGSIMFLGGEPEKMSVFFSCFLFSPPPFSPSFLEVGICSRSPRPPKKKKKKKTSLSLSFSLFLCLPPSLYPFEGRPSPREPSPSTSPSAAGSPRAASSRSTGPSPPARRPSRSTPSPRSSATAAAPR